MDFIERVFGLSPDGGSGSFEAMLFLVPAILVCAVAWHRARRRTIR